MGDQIGGIVGLGARVHLFVHPTMREAFTALFRDVLGCSVFELGFGLEYPILLIRFDDGSACSAEFSDLAPTPDRSRVIDDARAFRGAWIEFRTRELERLQAALREAGLPEFRHPGSNHVYFVAPGGQVFRLLDVDYVGP